MAPTSGYHPMGWGYSSTSRTPLYYDRYHEKFSVSLYLDIHKVLSESIHTLTIGTRVLPAGVCVPLKALFLVFVNKEIICTDNENLITQT